VGSATQTGLHSKPAQLINFLAELALVNDVALKRYLALQGEEVHSYYLLKCPLFLEIWRKYVFSSCKGIRRFKDPIYRFFKNIK
jgi:hypothetical protein